MTNTAITSILEHPLQIEGIPALISSFLAPGEETCQAARIGSAWLEARSSLTCLELIARLGRERLKSRDVVEAYLRGCRLIYPFLSNFYFGNVLHLVRDRTIALNIMTCLPILKLERISMGDLPITCLHMLSGALLTKTLKIQQLALPFPPANRFRNGNFCFPHISSENVTKLQFILRGVVHRNHVKEIAENFPALESLTIVGDAAEKGSGIDICGLLLKLPFLSSLEFCQLGISFTGRKKAPMSYLDSLPPHAYLKHLSFTNCQVNSGVGIKLLEKMPNLNDITYKDCTFDEQDAAPQ